MSKNVLPQIKKHMQNKKYLDALKLIKKKLKTEPKNTYVLNYLGIYHFKTGDNKKALEVFEGILGHSPNDFNALNNIGALSFVNKQFTKSVIYYTKALALNPFNSRTLDDLNNSHKELKSSTCCN